MLLSRISSTLLAGVHGLRGSHSHRFRGPTTACLLVGSHRLPPGDCADSSRVAIDCADGLHACAAGRAMIPFGAGKRVV